MPKPESSCKKTFGRKDKTIRGVVTVRKCASCAHHEIGIVTEDGLYLPLKPGMKVEVIQEN